MQKNDYKTNGMIRRLLDKTRWDIVACNIDLQVLERLKTVPELRLLAIAVPKNFAGGYDPDNWSECVNFSPSAQTKIIDLMMELKKEELNILNNQMIILQHLIPISTELTIRSKDASV